MRRPATHLSGAPALIVLAKEPVPGRVKTRLVPPLTYAAAAELAAAALSDTILVVDRVPARGRFLAFDGDVAGWLPSGWWHVAQPGGGLDERLAAAFDAVGPGPAVLVGMDTPQLSPTDLAGFDPSRYDACFGPAVDGGYWTIGFADARNAAAAIRGVPMSSPHTGAVQLRRLQEQGMRVQILDTLVDVDTIDAAAAVAELAPHTAFAAALALVGRAA
jgi:glycosyltransferase A (GT-A) superfamily protein (DUF2064 family)